MGANVVEKGEGAVGGSRVMNVIFSEIFVISALGSRNMGSITFIGGLPGLAGRRVAIFCLLAGIRGPRRGKVGNSPDLHKVACILGFQMHTIN